MSSLILNNSKDREPTDWLDDLFLCLTNLMFDHKTMSYIKNFWIFMCFKPCQLPLVLSLHTSGKSLAWSSLLLGSCRQKIDPSKNFSSPGLADPTAPASPHMAWSVLCGLGNSKLGTIFHECQIEGKGDFLHLWLGKKRANTAQDAPSPHCYKGTFLAHAQFILHDLPDPFL